VKVVSRVANPNGTRAIFGSAILKTKQGIPGTLSLHKLFVAVVVGIPQTVGILDSDSVGVVACVRSLDFKPAVSIILLCMRRDQCVDRQMLRLRRDIYQSLELGFCTALLLEHSVLNFRV
jgi:hypothetical protein